jgi:hypothetical protein
MFPSRLHFGTMLLKFPVYATTLISSDLEKKLLITEAEGPHTSFHAS